MTTHPTVQCGGVGPLKGQPASGAYLHQWRAGREPGALLDRRRGRQLATELLRAQHGPERHPLALGGALAEHGQHLLGADPLPRPLACKCGTEAAPVSRGSPWGEHKLS